MFAIEIAFGQIARSFWRARTRLPKFTIYFRDWGGRKGDKGLSTSHRVRTVKLGFYAKVKGPNSILRMK